MGSPQQPNLKANDKKLGQILIETKLVTIEQLAQALYLQKQMQLEGQSTPKVGHILVFQKVITLAQLQDALRKQTMKASATKALIDEAKHELQSNRLSQIDKLQKKKMNEEEKKGILGRLSFLLKK